MRVIYKYRVGFEPDPKPLPLGDLVSFGLDGRGELCVWQYESSDITNLRSNSYRVVGTGWEIPDGYHPVVNSSVTTPDGFVWHLVVRLDES